MLLLALAVFSFCLLLGIRNAWRTRSSIRWIENGNRAHVEPPPSRLRFVILLPLLREQGIVAKMLRRMEALDCRATAETRFVFVSTSREGDHPGSTAHVLDAALQGRDRSRFIHLHCNSGTDRYKADQLNFALQRLGLLGQRSDDLFIGVYDADSSPDPRTLSYVVSAVAGDPGLKAIQQVPLYFQNIRDAARLRDLYLMSRPVHNLLFALTVEVPGMRKQPAVFSSPRGSWRRTFNGWLSHGLGHGQFFRMDVLTELGGFRPPSCDTQLGHMLAFSGIPIHPHPMLDVGQTPDSISVLIQQGVVWFNSMNTFWRTKELATTFRGPNYSGAAAWVMMARLVHSNLAWAIYPLLFLAALIWSLATGHWPLAAFGVLAWAVYLLPITMILGRFDLWTRLCGGFEPIRSVSLRTRIGIVAMFGVEKLGSCISPFVWLAQAAYNLPRGAAITLHKTERVET